MIDENIRYQAISRAENGEDKQVIANSLGVNYATVLRWHREYKDAKANGELAKLFNVDKLALASIGELVSAPIIQEEMNESVAKLTKKVDGLTSLQDELIITAKAINTKIKSHILSVEHVSELVELTECLTNLQNAFFNKNMTQVNVQNNYGEGSKYGSFLNDKPKNN